MKNRLHEELSLDDWELTGVEPSDDGLDLSGGDSGEQKKPGKQKPPRKKPADNKVCINNVQNLLKELNPSFNVSGSMDANTLIEIMNKLNELEKSLTVKKDEVTSVEKTKILPTFDITEP